MKKFIIAIICCFLSVNSFTQQEGSNIVIGTNHTIKSTILNQDRAIQVYVPESYNESEREYPVLYVIDGQEYFLHGVAYQEMLRFRDKTPEFIVVGIQTDRQQRRILLSEESIKFAAFLSSELIPFIDSKYRTAKKKERLYFGWEMAAGFGLELIGNDQSLFSGYILASPTHKNTKRKTALDVLKNEESNPFLLVSAAPEESWIHNDSIFIALMNSHDKWRFTEFDREDHYTTPFKSIHEGLSDYFSDYKPIRLRSLKAYDEFGGLEALEDYYRKRGERYGLSTEIHRETKHFLIYSALQEDNIERFDLYITKFNNFIPSITRDIWINRYAQFYLKHKRNDKAFQLFKLGLEKFPESSLLYKGLGDVYVEMNQPKKALNVYEKSIGIDSDQPELKTKIEALRN